MRVRLYEVTVEERMSTVGVQTARVRAFDARDVIAQVRACPAHYGIVAVDPDWLLFKSIEPVGE